MDWEKVTLTIDDIDFHRGGEMSVYVFLEAGFPIKHQKALKRYRFDVARKSHQLIIAAPNVPFALKAHHDEDRSGTVTKNWTGFIPAEGFGFSSGAKMNFGPPTFKKAMMTLPADLKTHLFMIYP